MRFFVVMLLGVALLTPGCIKVGPDFTPAPAPVPDQWLDADDKQIRSEPDQHAEWWKTFNDPVLDQLVQNAYAQNLPLQIAGLRVLEARAELGFVTGHLFPQVQQARGDIAAVGASKNEANTYGIDPNWKTGGLGFDSAWEMDFWGKFRRGVESADASLIASIADYDDILVALTAEVARAYTLIRTFEERILIAEQNIKIQQRSFEITGARFEAGLVTELDHQQAKALLNGTKALIPTFEIGLRQAQNALSILLGTPPGDLHQIIIASGSIPAAPVEVAVGIPAELLRRRPDIRRAEMQAAAQSALIGVARADLFPHFSLVGSIGLRSSDNAPTRAGGAGGSSFGDLFNSDSFEYFVGPSFRWDILNYGRIKNEIRVQDARFQQLQVNYQETVLRAAQEVEDGMVGFLRGQEKAGFLNQSVAAYKRSVDLAETQYREGLIDYLQVLDNQRSLTAEQDRLIETQGDIALSLIGMYKALGGGWQIRSGQEIVPAEMKKEMAERTDWGDLLDSEELEPKSIEEGSDWRWPDW
jgi:NodT family efflux transporter outer membrane factor (OMF) lipoprotein